MIGKKIAHYEIIEELGEGGVVVVYKARDTKLDRFVALKFLPPHLSQDEEGKKRFIHEAKATAALNHPNIATIYAIEEHDDELFIGMSVAYKPRDTKPDRFVALKFLQESKDQIAPGCLLSMAFFITRSSCQE